MKDTWQAIEVGDDEFRWQMRHGWVLEAGRRVKGVSVVVARDPGQTRELVVDFAFSTFGVDRSPPAADITSALVPAIRAAIAAGWRPDSRGRAFRFEWPEEPPA